MILKYSEQLLKTESPDEKWSVSMELKTAAATERVGHYLRRNVSSGQWQELVGHMLHKLNKPWKSEYQTTSMQYSQPIGNILLEEVVFWFRTTVNTGPVQYKPIVMIKSINVVISTPLCINRNFTSVHICTHFKMNTCTHFIKPSAPPLTKTLCGS